MKFALIGNQNCGKTTLFNQLTGSNQHVGNFPGVTVEKKSGIIRGQKNSVIVDLPGIYSLSPYTSEEVVTRDFLLSDETECIVNIVDATNIERNLYLTLQLIDVNKPMIIALNMMDEIRANGSKIDVEQLEKKLGVKIVCISASKNEGIDYLVEQMLKVGEAKQRPTNRDFCIGAIHRAIHSIAISIEDHSQNLGVDKRFAAVKLIEGDEPMVRALELSENEKQLIEHTVFEMEAEIGLDREAALAEMRYDYIDKVCQNAVFKRGKSKEYLRSRKIDKLLTHRFLAIPMFIIIMGVVFWLSFGVIGSFLSDLMAMGIDAVSDLIDNALTSYGINPVVHSLVVDGILAGIGSVLSFLPIVVVLFFFLSILEDSGYMARIAFVMDKTMRKIGLSGKSFVPLIIGFGCSVPAMMSTRTLTSERDRKMTIFLVPFISCSAKLPIYAMFTYAFFPSYSTIAMICLYVFGILMGVVSGFILNRVAFKGSSNSFIMELPNYRLPSAKSVVLMIWEKAKDFLTRAFTVIFVASIVIWFLQSFDSRLNFIEDSSNSLLAHIGQLISPIFIPLGFASWQNATALITGLMAKESVISTLAVLTGADMTTLPAQLSGMFSPLSAVAFLVFVLLYVPCIATIKVTHNELKSKKTTALMIVYQIGFAWVASCLVYNIGLLFVG